MVTVRCAQILVAAAPLLAVAAPAHAEDDEAARLRRIEDRLASQSLKLEAQEHRLQTQAALIERQRLQLAALRGQALEDTGELRARGAAPEGQGPGAPPPPPAPQAQTPASASDAVRLRGPVGAAPESAAPEAQVREVAALPEHVGVLTPKGQLIVEPSVEYSNTSSNRLVFRGVQVIPGINFGLIEADEADRSSVTGAIGVRYGLTDRLEIEAKVPYVYRQDRVQTVATVTANTALERGEELEGYDIGDIELAARYQINSGARGRPIFVANARLKPPTGTGPYEVDFDEDGVARSLATGSGFWGAEAGVTMVYPTDPAVIFAGLSYLTNFPRDIDQVIAGRRIGRVDPGDSIGATIGFGLALNPRFSVSFGYSHNYIFRTESEIMSEDRQTPVTVSSDGFHVGAFQVGWSFRLRNRLTLSNNLEFGVTSDAPDLRIVFRAPYRF